MEFGTGRVEFEFSVPVYPVRGGRCVPDCESGLAGRWAGRGAALPTPAPGGDDESHLAVCGLGVLLALLHYHLFFCYFIGLFRFYGYMHSFEARKAR